MKHRFVIVLSLLFLFVIATTWVLADSTYLPLVTTPAETSACVNNTLGTIRIIEEGETVACAEGEMLIQWNATGPPGEQGPQGEQGPPGPSIAFGQESWTDAAGGPGGNPFGPLSCPPDSIAVGFTGRAGADIDRTELRCKELYGLSLVGPVLGPETSGGVVGGFGGSDYDDQLLCPPQSALTGIRVRAGEVVAGFVIDQMGSRCTTFDGTTSNVGFVGSQQSSGTVVNLDCPSGAIVTGWQGRQGGLLDQIQLRCTQTMP